MPQSVLLVLLSAIIGAIAYLALKVWLFEEQLRTLRIKQKVNKVVTQRQLPVPAPELEAMQRAMFFADAMKERVADPPPPSPRISETDERADVQEANWVPDTGCERAASSEQKQVEENQTCEKRDTPDVPLEEEVLSEDEPPLLRMEPDKNPVAEPEALPAPRRRKKVTRGEVST